jgi:hypothetical protein
MVWISCNQNYLSAQVHVVSAITLETVLISLPRAAARVFAIKASEKRSIGFRCHKFQSHYLVQ